MTENQKTQETQETTETTVEKPVVADPAEEKRVVATPAKETVETNTETTTTESGTDNR